VKGVIRLDTAGAENYKARGSCSVDQSLDVGAGAKDASDARPALDTTADGLTSLAVPSYRPPTAPRPTGRPLARASARAARSSRL